MTDNKPVSFEIPGSGSNTPDESNPAPPPDKHARAPHTQHKGHIAPQDPQQEGKGDEPLLPGQG